MRVTFLIRTLYLLLLLGASTALAYPSSSQREARDSKPLDDSAVQSSDGVPRVPDTKSLIEAGMIYAAGSLGLMGSVVWLHQKSWELKDCLDPRNDDFLTPTKDDMDYCCLQAGFDSAFCQLLLAHINSMAGKSQITRPDTSRLPIKTGPHDGNNVQTRRMGEGAGAISSARRRKAFSPPSAQASTRQEAGTGGAASSSSSSSSSAFLPQLPAWNGWVGFGKRVEQVGAAMKDKAVGVGVAAGAVGAAALGLSAGGDGLRSVGG